MANALYPKFKESILQAGLNLSSDTIKVALVDTNVYTYNSTHQFYSSVSSGAVGTPVTLTSKTFTNGVFDAADATLTSVTGAQSEALVLYKDTGNNATSNLVAFLDTGFTGMPVTPNGGNIGIQWNASGIFSL